MTEKDDCLQSLQVGLIFKTFVVLVYLGCIDFFEYGADDDGD